MERLPQFLGHLLARRARSRDDVEDLIRAAVLEMPAHRRTRGRVHHLDSFLGASSKGAQALAPMIHLRVENPAQSLVLAPRVPVIL